MLDIKKCWLQPEPSNKIRLGVKEFALSNGFSFFDFKENKGILRNAEFIQQTGKPDVIITDPPRAGMHPALVDRISHSGAGKVVYVSCNPATLARDIAILSEKYIVARVQAFDMFPHTHHAETVALLEAKC